MYSFTLSRFAPIVANEKKICFFKYIFITMNEKENQFSEDYLKKLQEQFSESKCKEDIRKKRAEGGKKV